MAEGARQADLVRVLAAATLTGAPVAISSALPLHAQLIELFGAPDSPIGVAEVLVESDARWHARLLSGETGAHRLRLLGADPAALAALLGATAHPAVYADPVTAAGRIELPAFLREQSVSITVHRFGYPDARMSSLIV